MKRLNGNKFFIDGNHDNKDIIKLYKKYGTYLGPLAFVKIQDKKVMLCHYSMEVWEQWHKGSYHLYGHSHGFLPDNPNRLKFDVSCNIWDYTPISWEQIELKMSTKNFVPYNENLPEWPLT